ncbi:MAG: FAD-binding oxidoreductase, partial [Halofilum sp. (in: g-proteobacteria)]
GIQLPYGCRSGHCGACGAELRSGRVYYPDGPPSALTEAAQHAILCRAVPETDCEFGIREIDSGDAVAIRSLAARVTAREDLAPDVTRLWLRLPASEWLRFSAGQYVDLLLRDGHRRSYSLANPPEVADRLELHVRRLAGGHFSEHLFARITEKSLLRFEGPLGSFYLREDSGRPLIMMGGGTGFAPIKSMVEHALARGLERPLHLFWGVRARRDLYLGELAARWAREHERVTFTPVLSAPASTDDWPGTVGFVHEAVLACYPDLSGHEVYMAGPPGMVAASRQRFATAGLPAQHLYFDAFESAPDGR